LRSKFKPVAPKGYPVSIAWHRDGVGRIANLIERCVFVTIEVIFIPTELAMIAEARNDATDVRRGGIVPKVIRAIYVKGSDTKIKAWLEIRTATNVRNSCERVVSPLTC
jgi:hypothetical protein